MSRWSSRTLKGSCGRFMTHAAGTFTTVRTLPQRSSICCLRYARRSRNASCGRELLLRRRVPTLSRLPGSPDSTCWWRRWTLELSWGAITTSTAAWFRRKHRHPLLSSNGYRSILSMSKCQDGFMRAGSRNSDPLRSGNSAHSGVSAPEATIVADSLCDEGQDAGHAQASRDSGPAASGTQRVGRWRAWPACREEAWLGWRLKWQSLKSTPRPRSSAGVSVGPRRPSRSGAWCSSCSRPSRRCCRWSCCAAPSSRATPAARARSTRWWPRCARPRAGRWCASRACRESSRSTTSVRSTCASSTAPSSACTSSPRG